MGKSKRLKQLKRIARELPPMHEKVYVGEKKLGKELLTKEELSAGINNGFALNGVYRVMIPVVKDVNHYKKLKKASNGGKQISHAGNYVYAVMSMQDGAKLKPDQKITNGE